MPSGALAVCDVIPGVTKEFRGALGTLNRPFAIPNDQGEQVTIRLKPMDCDAGSMGFEDLPGGLDPEDDYFVTVLFEPPDPTAPRNAVVLSMPVNHDACEAALPPTGSLPGGGTATCPPSSSLPLDPEFSIRGECVEGPNAGQACADATECGVGACAPLRLVFRFPDTDALLGTPDDDRTLTGPATIAVTPVTDPLPLGLANARCADTAGLTACIDELYARDGTCETAPAHMDATFGHFTALPPANDYQALCTTPDTPCSGLQDEVRFTVDAAGNALVPMDYRGVLIESDRIPIPRLILGNTGIEAFAGSGTAVDVPSDAFVASYAPGGQKLPPIFTPIANPDAVDDLSLFGSVDAPVGVIRVQHRGCVGGLSEGLACAVDGGCGGGVCQTLFDFSDRLAGAAGPVLIAQGEFTIEAQNPVPLDGLIESESVFAFVANEAIEQKFLNDDSDQTDPVLRLRDRRTGQILPIGTDAAPGRAVTRVRNGRFRFPAVTVEGDLVAYLDPEPLEGNCETPSLCDRNGDGDVFDTLLRVYRFTEDCGDGASCADEVAPLLGPFAVEAAPLIAGRSISLTDGILYFLRPEHANIRHKTTLVSRSIDGHAGDDRSNSHSHGISLSGNQIVFTSFAGNLVPNDDNNVGAFLFDRESDATTRIGTVANAISYDGREVLLLVLGASGVDRFVLDLRTSELELVSTEILDFFRTHMSGDGRFVVSRGPNSPNCRLNLSVLLLDRATGREQEVGCGALASEGSLSRDGRYLAFSALRDPNVGDGIGLFDRLTEEANLVSLSSAQRPAVGAQFPSISADGSVVAFWSFDNLVPGDTDSAVDLYVRDLRTQQTELASVASGSLPLPGRLGGVSHAVSPDGRFVAFRWLDGLSSAAPSRLLLHDRATGLTETVAQTAHRLNVSSLGGLGGLSLSLHAKDVLFPADNALVPEDTNDLTDVYLYSPDKSDTASDLLRDGDFDDLVLQALDLSRPDRIVTLGPASEVVTATGSAAFLFPEAATRFDRNGDGDLDDAFVYVAIRGNEPLDLELEAVEVVMSPQVLAARAPAADAGAPFAHVCDWPTRRACWKPIGSRATEIAAAGEAVALLAPECSHTDPVGVCLVSDADLNADGDFEDRVVRVYVADENRRIELGQAAEDFVMGQRLLAFRTRESSQGRDLNGDGDDADDVLQVFDLLTERLFNTMNAVTPCPLEACDPRFPYRVEGDTVVYLTLEAEQGGRDLNGDGDATDLVKQVFNAREAALLSPASGEAAGCVDAIASASAGICTTTGASCTTDADCNPGTCFLPPGGCIADLGTSCVCGENGCLGCGAGEFCSPVPGGGGQGICKQDQGPCASDADCSDDRATCQDAAADIQRLFSPIADMGRAGDQALYSSGRCIRTCEEGEDCGPSGQQRRGSCRTTGDCQDGFECSNDLIIAGAADADQDGMADPYDNCPGDPNIDQADLDRDEIGDVCDLMTCGNGIRERAEQCDDGNTDDGDGCNARCLTPVGELLAFYDTSMLSGSLVGDGPGKSGRGRAKSLRNQLEAAGRNFSGRASLGTCNQLASILDRTDGEKPPPDFVSGDAAPELADRIVALRQELGCDLLPPVCGRGAELALVLPGLVWLSRRVRRGG